MRRIFLLLVFLLLLKTSLNADVKEKDLPKEDTGNRKLPYEEIGPDAQERQRLKYKYTIEIGLPDGLNKLSVISLGHNFNGFLSLGISQNFNRGGYYDYAYYDGTRTLSKGVYTEAGSVPAQEYGKTFPLPQMGTNLFLHLYPLIKENIPIYVPLYLGRTLPAIAINHSENAIINPIYQDNRPMAPPPMLSMSTDARATMYYGIGLGTKLILPGGVLAGIEFGLVTLHNPHYNYNIQASILNRSPMSLSEFYILQDQLKYAVKPIDQVKLNYGFTVGIAF